MNEPHPDVLEFRLKGIFVTEFAYTEPSWDERTIGDVQIGFRWHGINNVNERELAVHCHVFGILPTKPAAEQVFSLKAHYIFEFRSFDGFTVEDDAVTVPDELSITLVSIAYTTTRGILFERLAGSSLPNFVLPIVDPKVLHARSFNNEAVDPPEPSSVKRKKKLPQK